MTLLEWTADSAVHLSSWGAQKLVRVIVAELINTLVGRKTWTGR